MASPLALEGLILPPGRVELDPTQRGIGGAPTRASTLPEKADERKRYPVASGVLDYFPDALVAVAGVSWEGNNQHNPGQPLHWARSKSSDEADTMIRHFLQRGSLDTDGIRHSAKMVWRALALLQKEIEQERNYDKESKQENAPVSQRQVGSNPFEHQNTQGPPDQA